ncbi:MAG TPA: ATP-binding protein [Bacilli bacterium]|nr:ATP-binding protein [Bacilli bacterium]
MRRKLIISNAFLVFFSLLLLFITSLVVIVAINNNNSKAEAKGYLYIACEIFDGDNATQTVTALKKANADMRITIIDLQGSVVIDTSDVEEFESHFDRPEIQNPGKVFMRYSKTLEIQMLYVAQLDDGYFVRVAIPLHSINAIVNWYSLIGLLSLVVILGLSILLSTSLSKRTLAPINQVIGQLGNIVNTKNYYGIDSVETLIEEINSIKAEINTKIMAIKQEKDKLDYIINDMKQGLIVISEERNIMLINAYIANILNFKQEDVIDKNYLYLIRNQEIQAAIEAAFANQKVKVVDLVLQGRIYLLSFNLIENSWIGRGVVVSVLDVTEQRKVEKVKREFFANASHELKSPLTSILGYQQMILEGIIDDEQAVKEATAKTIKEAMRMDQIIIEMLELSKLESGIQFVDEDVFLPKIVEEILEQYHQELARKEITVHLDLAEVTKHINRTLAIELIRNLIDNAIKYNKIKGMITITLNEQKLVIRDTGIGIPEADISRVFERFYRVDKAKSKEQGGTGLGLAIVKHICGLYGYQINLQSVVDKQTTITINFK